MPYTPEQIQERYDRLPPDIREAIDSVSTTSIIVDIGQKNGLMYDQIEELVNEVGLVLVGLTPSPMFVSNIARRMQIDTGRAMLVTQDINKQIFDKMRDSLKKIEEEHGEGTERFSDENGNPVPEPEPAPKPPVPAPAPVPMPTPPQKSEQTMQLDAEKARKDSFVSAVEKAGGFVIEKPEQAPLQAEEMVHDQIARNLESRKNAAAATPQSAQPQPVPKTQSVMMQGRSLSTDVSINEALAAISQAMPDQTIPQQMPAPAQIPVAKAQETSPLPAAPSQKPVRHVETAAEKEVEQESIVDTLLSKGVAMSLDSDPPKQTKVKPYDGTDPYRETAE